MIFELIVAVILLFCLVVFFGAPYLPTMKKQSNEALNMLDLRPGQTLLELGCGDGRVVRSAGRRGLKVVGYELNPILVLICLISTYKYRNNVKIIWGSFWRADLPKADGVFVFLIDKYMKKLDHKMENYPHKPIKLVSYAFNIPDKNPHKTSKSSYLYLYK